MSIKGELVRVRARDGLELVGFYASPEGGARRAVLHTHGLAGNFYENHFVDSIYNAVVREGLAFLTFNNRGHDHRSDNLRGVGVETSYSPGGMVWDIYGDCIHDIVGCADFLASRGHSEIYFQGHSLGACKVVYYLSERPDKRAVGTVLISPPDMFALEDERTGGGLEALVAEARAHVDAGADDTLMEVGRAVPVAARAFLSVYGHRSSGDVFPFARGAEGDYRRLASLPVPVLATYGTIEEAVTVPVEKAVSLLRDKATQAPRVEAVVIEGANHSYWGKETELARVIAEFVEP
jgi:pimeloyl-ACP methyl ester carboxylesterase